MKSVKPGRGPLLIRAVISVGVVAIALLGFKSVTGFDNPAFGWIIAVFIVIALAIGAYSLFNALRKDRDSIVDITADGEEPDFLNAALNKNGTALAADGSAYCPYCGAALGDGYEFCNKCGRQLPK